MKDENDQTSSHERREGLWPQGWVNAHQVSGVWQHSPPPPTTTNLQARKGSLQGGVGVSATGGIDEMVLPILDMSINKGEGQVGLRHLANIQGAQLNLSSR